MSTLICLQCSVDYTPLSLNEQCQSAGEKLESKAGKWKLLSDGTANGSTVLYDCCASLSVCVAVSMVGVAVIVAAVVVLLIGVIIIVIIVVCRRSQ